MNAWWNHTCVPLEACAPLCAGYYSISMYIAGLEECVGTRLISVHVKALDLWLVQLEVKVCVQPGKHPTQRVLTKRWCPNLKLSWEKAATWLFECILVWTKMISSVILRMQPAVLGIETMNPINCKCRCFIIHSWWKSIMLLRLWTLVLHAFFNKSIRSIGL